MARQHLAADEQVSEICTTEDEGTVKPCTVPKGCGSLIYCKQFIFCCILMLCFYSQKIYCILVSCSYVNKNIPQGQGHGQHQAKV